MKDKRKVLNAEQVELINACLADIVKTAQRTTAGNISHNIASIKAMAMQGINILNGEFQSVRR